MLDFFLLHSFLCKEHKNQNDDMTFCVVYTETCVSLQLVTTKSVWKYRTEWNFEKRISDSGPSKHAWILVYSSRIKFYSHPQNPGNVPCKLHEKPCKVHGFRCSLHTSRTCTYWLIPDEPHKYRNLVHFKIIECSSTNKSKKHWFLQYHYFSKLFKHIFSKEIKRWSFSF